MQEHTTEAFVLDVEAIGEADLRVHLFTKNLGRVIARAKSARKPSAKLAAHLQPLSLTTVRLIERQGMQVVDALVREQHSGFVASGADVRATVGVAHLIRSMTDLHQPDTQLWALFEKQKLASAATLKILGFDPAHARCTHCGKAKPEHFVIHSAEYMCQNCLRQSAGRATQIVV
jgi:DNA repair protein RecO (recombination protein O)